MIFSGPNVLLTGGILLLAMALGALVALIGVEIKKKWKHKASPKSRSASAPRASSEEEKMRRRKIVTGLMDLYSGVHSTNALSDFLNMELERRHETWRVHIPADGPGEIYDLESAE